MSHPKVKVSKIVQAKKWQAVRLITHVEEFPKYMPNVNEVRVLEKGAYGAVTCWNVEVDKIPLSWKEKEEFDLRRGVIRFQLIEGDIEKLDGSWHIREAGPGKIEITVEAELKIGIPMIENILGDAFAAKLEANFSGMLAAIAERLLMGRYRRIGRRQSSDIRGFGVVAHPYNYNHLVRYFQYYKPDIKLPSREFVSKIFDLTPAYKSYDIPHFRSRTGKETHGYFIVCPIIPDMIPMNPERVVEKVKQTCKIAESLGVGIVALGGFTSIAGEKYGKSLAGSVNVPVTTGNTFTSALAIDGMLKAAKLMDIDLAKAKAVIIGGAGDIGSTCARVLSELVAEVTLTGRNEKNMMEVERILSYYGKAKIHISTDNNKAIRGADIVLAAASASASVVDFRCFKPGAVICDIGYPKNISYTECDRRDILIFSGGIAKLPSEFNLGFDIGMPNTQVIYGCFSESILLDLEERYENFSSGKGSITKEKMDFIRGLARKHGFELAPFFWGNRLLTDKDLDEIRDSVRRALAG